MQRVKVRNRSRIRHSNKVTSLSPLRIGNRECISAGCTWSFSVAWSSVESKEEWGKEAHDRHASPSVRTCFLLLLLFLLFLLLAFLFGVRRSVERFRGAGESGRGETNEEEEPDIRRGAQERTGKRERGTRGKRTDVQQRQAMQNLTVQGTGASDDGSREFVLVPPSRNFVPYSFFFSRRSVPVRSLARL